MVIPLGDRRRGLLVLFGLLATLPVAFICVSLGPWLSFGGLSLPSMAAAAAFYCPIREGVCFWRPSDSFAECAHLMRPSNPQFKVETKVHDRLPKTSSVPVTLCPLFVPCQWVFPLSLWEKSCRIMRVVQCSVSAMPRRNSLTKQGSKSLNTQPLLRQDRSRNQPGAFCQVEDVGLNRGQVANVEAQPR
jgi:hypothetical protein